MIHPNSPDHAQPADSNHTTQLRWPSQIQVFRPCAHGHIHRHGADPYNICATTLRAYASCGMALFWLCDTRRTYWSSMPV
jgi:hypothetical protein